MSSKINLPSPLPPFHLIYPTTTRTSWPPTQPSRSSSASSDKLRINILDSSFNPPHLAHLSLASMNPSNSSPFDARLLVISSSNADKGDMGDEELKRRLEMMMEMAKEMSLKEKDGGEVGVAIVEGARFVDKSKVIKEWLEEKLGKEREVELVFALGWDTLIRFFNPKYYPSSFHSSMTSFFSTSSILCARRGSTSPSEIEQFLFSDDVKEWRDKVEMCEVMEEAFDVSSTEIRKAVKEGSWGKVERWVPVKGVREVIKREGMYEE